MVTAKVDWYRGYPALLVNGEPVPPMAMTTQTEDPVYLAALGKAGVRLFYEICATPWLDPGSVQALSRRLEVLVRSAPRALVILRVSLHPPMSWIREHPEELVTYEDGSRVAANPHDFLWPGYDKGVPNVYSLHSARWREDAGKAVAELIRVLDATPYADHIIGFFLAAGGTSEWYTMAGTMNRERGIVSDYSAAFRLEFGRLLKEKYGTEAALRSAWGDRRASFADPAIPDYASRRVSTIDEDLLKIEADSYLPPDATADSATVGSFLDADRHQRTADFYEAWHRGTADSIVHFARILKEVTENRRVVGAFYGSYGCTHFFESGTVSGVLRILDSGVVDFLAAPGLYENRLPRGYTAQREMQDSFLLRKRIFVVEEDTRTYRASQINRDFTGTHTLRDTVDVMKRDFGRNVCEELHAWWFDMAPKGGWYDDPAILDLMRRQQELAAFSYGGERTKANEIALIYDEESTRYVSNLSSVDVCHWFRQMEVHRIGAPVDYYFHNDLAHPGMPDYRLYIFVNVYHLDDQERAELDHKVKRKGATALWLYAPGFINPDRKPRLSAEHVAELVGMRMGMEASPWIGRFTVERAAHPILAHSDPDRIYGFFDRPVLSFLWNGSTPPNTRLYPLFYPDDTAAVTLGRFQAIDRPALAMREFPEWRSVYCGAKVIRSDLISSIARYAGCHIYCSSDECLYANRRFVVIHAKDTGRKELRFPRACSPFEVYEKRSYGSGIREVALEMRAGETLMFHLDGPC
jgi:hypothetical protein